MNTTTGILTFKSFSKISGLVHGFSTLEFGSMRPSHINSQKSLELFARSLKIDPQNIIKMQQVHGNNIVGVNHKQKGQWIEQTDGMITKEKDLYLSVLGADCLPLLIYDTQKKYVGVVHAGWKGIYNEILVKAISQLKAKGSSPSNLIVGIGPSIRSCCYSVSRERAAMFSNKFQNSSNFTENRNGKFFLDLVSIAKQQLHETGIIAENIEDCGICTSDNIDKFYSFRKEGKNFGQFIGIIGLLPSPLRRGSGRGLNGT